MSERDSSFVLSSGRDGLIGLILINEGTGWSACVDYGQLGKAKCAL
jgi:hypothetical protein